MAAAVKKRSARKVRGKSLSFKELLKRIRKSFRQNKPNSVGDAISRALKIISNIKKTIRPARVIPIPKTGGILPLIPIFAGLSALGALAGGASQIAKVVNETKSAKQQLEEANRHNKTMEAIALRGKGLYLKPYKSGLGLFLKKSCH